MYYLQIYYASENPFLKMRVLSLMIFLFACAVPGVAGQLSFARPSAIFLPMQADVAGMKDGKPAGRWRDSEVTVVLRFDSAKDGPEVQSVQFVVTREGAVVDLGILSPDQKEQGRSAVIKPDADTCLTLIVPPATLLAWKAKWAVETPQDWQLFLRRGREARGTLVGTVRAVRLAEKGENSP